MDEVKKEKKSVPYAEQIQNRKNNLEQKLKNLKIQKENLDRKTKLQLVKIQQLEAEIQVAELELQNVSKAILGSN